MFPALAALSSLLLPPALAGPRWEFAPRRPAPPHSTGGAWLQPQLRWQQTDPEVASPGGPSFSLRRARLWAHATWLSGTHPAAVDGWRGPSLTAHIEVELAGDPHLADGYLDLRLGHPLQLRVGRFAVPGAHDRQVDDRHLLLPDRSASTRLLPGRDTGAAIQGFVGRHVLAWQLGAFNGSDGGEGDDGGAGAPGLRYAGRIEVSPLGGVGEARDLLRPDWRLLGHRGVPVGRYNPLTTLTVGVYASHTDRLDGPTRLAGADLFLHWRPVNLAAAAMVGRSADESDGADEGGAARDATTFGGWWVQLALLPPRIPWAWEHLALVARVDALDPAIDQAPATPTDPDRARRDLTLGARLMPGRPMFAAMDDATLLVAWIVRQEPDTMGYANDVLLVSAQLAW